MNDAAQPGPWGPRSAAGAMAEAERAASGLVPQVPAARPAEARAGDATPVRFTGQGGELFGLLAKGFLLQVITLGIYRFWLTTDIRRYYWSHTAAGGEVLAYTGRGIELLKGFLIALAILVPIQAAAFFLALSLPAAEFFVSAGVTLLLLFFGQYAVYAARRYRLTRTSFRGLRLRMTGSAWTYAAKGFGCFLVVIVTLGLAYPWAAALLERIKMRDTWYGDIQGGFTGTAGTLFRRGIVLWALGFGLPILILAGAILSVPTAVWNELFAAALTERFEPRGEAAEAIMLVAGAGFLSLLIPLLLFPAFQAVVFRWRMEGTRLGGAALATTFTIGQSYGVYVLGTLVIIGVMLALAMAVGAVAGGFVFALFASGNQGVSAGIAGIGVMALSYFVIFGGAWIAKQIFITLWLVRAQVGSLSVLNLAALDNARAHNVDASALGESLGDGVDFGIGL